jgi:hypothetical protein
MTITIRVPAAKRSFLIFCLCLAALYFAIISSQFVAYFSASQPNLASLKFALRLEPWNANYQYLLGQYYWWLQQRAEARTELKKAVGLNPHNSFFWLNLASVEDLLDRPEDARAAVKNAIAVGPYSPRIAVQAGNIYLNENQTQLAFAQFRRALEGAPYLAGQIIPMCWQAQPDASELLRDALPASSDIYSSFLEFLISQKQRAAAAMVWAQIGRLGQPVKINDVFDYVHYLIGEHRPDEARTVWRDAGSLAGLKSYAPSQQNLMVNGDFNLTVLNGGFDWTYEKQPGVSIELEPSQSEVGGASLMISYDSGGLEDSGIRQLISVSPNSTYHFSAHFKTENLEGAGGPHFVLQDAYTGESYFQSDELVNSATWRQVTVDFQTGPATHLLILRISRVPAGSAIRGKLWIGNLSLSPTGKQGGS